MQQKEIIFAILIFLELLDQIEIGDRNFRIVGGFAAHMYARSQLLYQDLMVWYLGCVGISFTVNHKW